MSVNMAAPSECPSCGEYDRCFQPGCICPMCSPPKNDPWGTEQSKALKYWTRLTPVMNALNATPFSWGWAGDSVEVFHIPDRDNDRQYFTVMCPSPGTFLVVHMQVVSPANREHPDEWDEVASLTTTRPQDVVEWIGVTS